MSQKSSTPPKGSASRTEHFLNSSVFTRWGFFAVGLGLLVASILFRAMPSLVPNGAEVAVDMAGRVGVVCVAIWLAWPVFMTVRRFPGGLLLVFGTILAMLMFTFRKQSIYMTAPILGVALFVSIGASWVRRIWKT